MLVQDGQEEIQEFVPSSTQEILEELEELGVQTVSFQSFTSDQLTNLLISIKKTVDFYRRSNADRFRKSADTVPILSTVDKKILKSLISSTGEISSLVLSKELGIPLSTVQRRRKRLESIFVEISYSLKPEKFGWRTVKLFISTERGMTSSIAMQLISWQEIVTYVYRTMGEATVDLEAEIVFRDNYELLDMIGRIKAISGVNNVLWSETIQVLGKNDNCYNLILEKS